MSDLYKYIDEDGNEFFLVPKEPKIGEPAGIGCEVSIHGNGTCGGTACHDAKSCSPRVWRNGKWIHLLKGRHVWKKKSCRSCKNDTNGDGDCERKKNCVDNNFAFWAQRMPNEISNLNKKGIKP